MLVIEKEYCKGYGKVVFVNNELSWAPKMFEELIDLDADFKLALPVEVECEFTTTPWLPDVRYLDAIRKLLQ
jgi:hypothetical protein